MKAVKFLNHSKKIEHIIKGFTLTRSLFVSSLLVGEKYTGKRVLIKTLFPNTVSVDASKKDELILALKNNSEIIIYNFEKLLNYDNLSFENKRIIAIANPLNNSVEIEKRFAFIYKMPNLEEREDLEELINFFQKKIEQELMLQSSIELDRDTLDLSLNMKSLKASIYKQLMSKTLTAQEIEDILFEYLLKNIEGNNAYRDNLSLFEKPLIKAGLQTYKSQLKLSKILGLNRNTLRKKIQEHELN
jgi:DNA-binding protein Fis